MHFALSGTCPVSALRGLGKRKYNFCLAHRAIREPDYLKFYREADGVVLDNGAFEGELVGFGELWELMKDIKPCYVVCPDVLKDPHMTDYLTAAFLEYTAYNRARSSPFVGRFIYVNHYKDPLEFFAACQRNIGLVIGLPKWNVERQELMRRFSKLGIIDYNWKFWALGSNGIDELKELSKYDEIIGCDSQKPWTRDERTVADNVAEWDQACQPFE